MDEMGWGGIPGPGDFGMEDKIEVSDWISNSKEAVIGRVLDIYHPQSPHGAVYEVWVADKLPNRKWHSKEVVLYQKGRKPKGV